MSAMILDTVRGWGDDFREWVDVGTWVDDTFEWVDDHFGEFLNASGDWIEARVTDLEDALKSPDLLVMAIIIALLAWLVRDWKVALASLAAVAVLANLPTSDMIDMALVFTLLAWLLRDWKIALISVAGFLLVIDMEQWTNTMDTLALVFLATLAALVIAIPIGIMAARWQRFSSVVRPIMDLMQTMPAFVWLVPVVTLFGLGTAGGLVATVIFALPPGVRLTELGIRQVDAEVVEAGQAFGGTPRQILGGIQMPLALPTVMAGVNQVIMLALSMAVVAGLVGGGGLGGAVISALQSLDVGLGFEAGLAVVILAIFLDRCTASVGTRRPVRVGGSLLSRFGGKGKGKDQGTNQGAGAETEDEQTAVEKARARPSPTGIVGA